MLGHSLLQALPPTPARPSRGTQPGLRDAACPGAVWRTALQKRVLRRPGGSAGTLPVALTSARTEPQRGPRARGTEGVGLGLGSPARSTLFPGTRSAEPRELLRPHKETLMDEGCGVLMVGSPPARCLPSALC